MAKVTRIKAKDSTPEKEPKNSSTRVVRSVKVKETKISSKTNKAKKAGKPKKVEKTTTGEEKGKKPEGKVVEVIGNIDVAGVDMLSIIKQYNLPYEFPKPVLDEAKKIAKEVSLEEIYGRYDFRGGKAF